MESQEHSENFLKGIYDEFHLTEETLQKDVKMLQQWLQEQPHLPDVEGIMIRVCSLFCFEYS